MAGRSKRPKFRLRRAIKSAKVAITRHSEGMNGFAGHVWYLCVGLVSNNGIKISMDGRGASMRSIAPR